VESFLKGFVREKYNRADVPLRDLELVFLDQFEFYLKTKKKLGQSTINKIIQRLRRPIRIAVSEGYLEKDPFIMYKVKYVKKEVTFLTPQELKLLFEHKFSQRRLAQVKDFFLFSCYTGLPFNEFSKLETKHVSVSFDGNLWINMKRTKTAKSLSIPLLPRAESIYSRYKPKNGLIFPRISNQKYNSYLKEIAEIVGIEKRLTTHMARRTFASTVLLYNNVPMEIVSELLGHSSIRVTEESYGKVVQSKVSVEMEKLKRSL
jgi:integrase